MLHRKWALCETKIKEKHTQKKNARRQRSSPAAKQYHFHIERVVCDLSGFGFVITVNKMLFAQRNKQHIEYHFQHLYQPFTDGVSAFADCTMFMNVC